MENAISERVNVYVLQSKEKISLILPIWKWNLRESRWEYSTKRGIGKNVIELQSFGRLVRSLSSTTTPSPWIRIYDAVITNEYHQRFILLRNRKVPSSKDITIKMINKLLRCLTTTLFCIFVYRPLGTTHEYMSNDQA